MRATEDKPMDCSTCCGRGHLSYDIPDRSYEHSTEDEVCEDCAGTGDECSSLAEVLRATEEHDLTHDDPYDHPNCPSCARYAARIAVAVTA